MDRPEIIRISPAATRSGHEAVAFIDRDLVQRKAYDARRSPRRRDIHVFHRGDDDPLQRMLNAIQPGSYIRPHRHLDPPKSESMILLQGMLGYVSFPDDGAPGDSVLLIDTDRGVYGCAHPARVWHTIFALVPDTVIFEVKPGRTILRTTRTLPRGRPKSSFPPRPSKVFLPPGETGAGGLSGGDRGRLPPSLGPAAALLAIAGDDRAVGLLRAGVRRQQLDRAEEAGGFRLAGAVRAPNIPGEAISQGIRDDEDEFVLLLSQVLGQLDPVGRP